jgi:putative tryptophan/tyrosine transport system substrate-binding protein
MRRRDLIALLGSTATAWPLVARAQQPILPVIGLLHGASQETFAANVAAFKQGLSQTGYIDGQNVMIEYRWANGRYDQLPVLAADLVRRRVAVIATPGNAPAALAAKDATTTILIVFGVGEDPVKMGLVASFAQPGGNATGFNFFANEIDAKRLGLMHEVLPKAKRFAVLVNPANAVSAENASKALGEAARNLALEIISFKASSAPEIDAAFDGFAQKRVDALFIAPDGFYTSRGVQFATLAVRERLPASCFAREMAEAGILMSYSTSLAEMFRQVGVYTGSILKGIKPADLPVLQATKFDFVINLHTARTLGVDIPPTLLARADEVIE